MKNQFKYLDYVITIETVQSAATIANQGLWSGSYQFAVGENLVQSLVQACSGQKSAQAAEEKALRFAVITIDTLREPRCPSRNALTASQAKRQHGPDGFIR